MTLKIAVLGASGMLGRHALEAAAAAGHSVRALIRDPAKRPRLGLLGRDARVCDSSDLSGMRRALLGVDVLIHAAAPYPRLPRPWAVEVAEGEAGVRRVFDAAERARVRTVVYVGAAIALPKRSDGQPADGGERYQGAPRSNNPYLRLKQALDELALARAAAGQDLRIAIPGMTLGEYDDAPTTGALVLGIARGTLTRFVNGTRNVVYAGDVGRGLIAVAERGRAGRRYILTGHNTTMATLVELIARRAEVPPPRPLPLVVARALAGLQRLRYRLGGPLPVLSDTAIAVMAYGQALDGRIAQAELGYRPVASLDETIARTLAYFAASGRLAN